jgi:hypothetical protein
MSTGKQALFDEMEKSCSECGAELPCPGGRCLSCGWQASQSDGPPPWVCPVHDDSYDACTCDRPCCRCGDTFSVVNRPRDSNWPEGIPYEPPSYDVCPSCHYDAERYAERD